MASKSSKKGSPAGFHSSVTAPVIGSLLSGAATTTPHSQNKPAPGKSGGAGGKAGPSSSGAEPTSNEIEVPAKLPLIAAVNGLGGPEVLLAATDLKLVVTKFPKGDAKTPSSENRFVQGLEGKLTHPTTTTIDPTGKKIPLKLAAGDLFRIRWDFVPGEASQPPPKGSSSNQPAKPAIEGKGLHINAEYGIGTADTSAKTKIAFVPSGPGPVVDAPTNRNPVRFDQIVKDLSSFLGYDSRPNPVGSVISMDERLHPSESRFLPDKPGDEAKKVAPDLEKIREQAAKRLAGRWAEMCRTGRGEGELAGHLEDVRGEEEEEARRRGEEGGKGPGEGAAGGEGAGAGSGQRGGAAQRGGGAAQRGGVASQRGGAGRGGVVGKR